MNDKDFGRELEFIDIAVEGIKLLLKNPERIKELQEESRTEKEIINNALNEYNRKHGTYLSRDEYFCIAMGLK